MLDIKEKRHITVVGRGGASNVEWDDIQDKPEFATVATSGSYNDLSDKPEIPGQVNADWDANSGVAQILNKPNLATVATSGDYTDLSNKPTILTQWFGTQQEYDAITVKDPDTIYNIEGGGQVQANWTESDSSDPSFIRNKPTLATVATSGSYNDLSNTPNLATVATSGSYNDLSDKPTIPSAQVNSDWNASSGVQQILNKPTLATVATSGSYSDLSNTPSLATVATSGSYNDLSNTPSLATVATSGDYTDLSNTPSLATVATTGDYDDLQNKPTIPAAPVQSDWNEADSSSLAYIANKPTIPAAQVQSDWNQSDNTQVDYIKNKPTIPTLPPMTTETLTFTLQGGTTKTIDFYTVPNYFYVEDISGSDNTLSIVKDGANAPTIEVFKSTDKVNWTSMGTTDTTAITATIPANSKLYLKATTNTWYSNKHNTITVSGNHNVGGNIMSLLYGDNFGGKTTFPATNSSFKRLFYNNYQLKGSNKLELAATTLVNGCYNQMFYGCYQMTTAPALPATTLVDWCYQEMFYFCSALTTAPVLPATTLPTGCYAYMFNYCGSLNRIETYANTKQNNSLEYWLQNVSATGDFYNLGSVTYTSGASGIPSGWTEHTSL